MSSARPFPWVALAVMGGFLVVTAVLAASGMRSNAAPIASPSASRSGPAVVSNLVGTSSGSTWQATQLLAAISQNATASKVTITASDQGGERVELTADFGRDELVRVHPGRSSEVWSGYVMSRLRAAVDGGTLNDTPNGKSFADTR